MENYEKSSYPEDESKEEKLLILAETEMQLRVDRAKKNAYTITIVDEAFFPFTSYTVISDSELQYLVEMRSLSQNTNSCSCPDYLVNRLGSCKHIESVRNFIRERTKKQFDEHVKEHSPRTEIFLDPREYAISIQWPNPEEIAHEVRKALAPYMSVDQTHVTNPLMGLVSIEHALAGMPPEEANKVRLSQHLLHWKVGQQQIHDRIEERKQFLADVEAGKRSLQMLSCTLFPYQTEGMLHLAFQGRAILADEMGLGKTIQAIAAAELLRRSNKAQRVLVVAPASLKGEWEEQIKRFVGLPVMTINGPRGERLASYQRDSFFYLVSYEQVRNDYEELNSMLHADIVILDEAQRIKNWQTKTAWAIKQLASPYAFVLTGTPLENRLEDIFSLMQMVDPKVLGSLPHFYHDFCELNDHKQPVKYKNLDVLHQKLKHVLLRRRKKEVEDQLPERIVNNYLVKMDEEQTVRYAEYAKQVASLASLLKRRPLTSDEKKQVQKLLACMRMVVDTPYILDPECRISPKLVELEEILLSFMQEKENKIIIFSEWERMLFLVKELAEKMGIDYEWHSGSISQADRRSNIQRFKDDPECRLFLTTDSGSTGLNLQVANVVINLDLPWNPAKLEQRIARAWRKNQSRVVQVINLIAEDTIEHRMLTLLAMKQTVADAVLDDDTGVTEIPIPSTQGASLEKLELLLGGSFSSQTISPESSGSSENPLTAKPHRSPVQIKEELLARHYDRIHLLETHQEHLFIVVDKNDELINKSICDIVSAPVVTMELHEYMTVQRLAQLGFVRFNDSDDKKILFQSYLINSEQRKQQQNKLNNASSQYKEAQRKLQMVELLKSGGFAIEAIPAAIETVQKGLEILKILNLGVDPQGLQLVADMNRVDNPEAFIQALALWMEEIEKRIIEYALGIEAEKK